MLMSWMDLEEQSDFASNSYLMDPTIIKNLEKISDFTSDSYLVVHYIFGVSH